MEVEKYVKTTVTLREHSSRKKITQVTINLNSLAISQNQTHKPHKTENSRLKESPTQQVVRLAKYRSNFPSSKHTILVAVGLASEGGRWWWSSSWRRRRKESIREENLTYIEAPVRQA